MVLAMVGDPHEHRPLDRHRAEDRERPAHPLLRLERAMGEQAVIADRDPDARQHVADGEERRGRSSSPTCSTAGRSRQRVRRTGAPLPGGSRTCARAHVQRDGSVSARGRRPVSGLHPLVRGLERRRNRRPARDCGAPRLLNRTRRRRPLAEPGAPLAERRLGLRRRRLPRRPRRLRDARRPRRADRRRGRAGHRASGSTSSRTTPPTTTRGSPTGPSTTSGRSDVPNDWTSIFTGGSAWQYDSDAAAVLPAPVRARAARPRLVERRTCATSSTTSCASGSTAACAASASTSRTALIKDRQLRDGVEHMRDRPEVHEIYRRWQQIAGEYIPKPTLMGETYVSLDQALRLLRAPRPGAELPVPARRVRRRRAAPDRRDDDEQAPEGPRAGVVRLEPRPLAHGDPLGRRRRARSTGPRSS